MSSGTDRAMGECPPRSDLEALVLGQLSEDRLEVVAIHTEECGTCSRQLQDLDERSDALLDGLRGLPNEQPEQLSVPDDLVATARATLGSVAGTVRIDPARKIVRALEGGAQRLGKFELLTEIGAGSFGYVFKARDTELDRYVAVKLRRGRPEASEEKARFLREARSAAQLEHPNIVSLYETGETDEGVAYLVTEFIDGENLEERIDKGVLPARDSAKLVAQIASALHEAHAHGVIHRDIKPSNVMLDADGEPHILDFGLAKREVGEATVTPEGVIMGTPAYMSPEIARGDAHNVDVRSDVYSLGVVLYELLTGERPFHGIRRMLVLQVLEDDPRPPRRLNDKVPRDLETICLAAMSKSPARRYATAQAFADDLDRFLRGEPVLARTHSSLERLWRWSMRNRLASSLFVTILFGSCFGFWHLTRLSSDLIDNSAIESAEQYASMLETVNAIYSSEVVDKLGHHGIEATANYADEPGGVPLPATMLTVLLERISQNEGGMSGRHYSEFPFRTRPASRGGGPQDEIEWQALRHLTSNPDVPFRRFVDGADGQRTLIFATARVMQASCVACHNQHPDSTKQDWAVGDVRGVLKIVRPLDQDVARTRAGMRSSFILVGVVSVLLLALCAGIGMLGERRRRAALRPVQEGGA